MALVPFLCTIDKIARVGHLIFATMKDWLVQVTE